MEKITIRMYDVPTETAIHRVLDTVKEGKHPGWDGSYCPITKYKDGIVLQCHRTKTGNHIFDVLKNT